MKAPFVTLALLSLCAQSPAAGPQTAFSQWPHGPSSDPSYFPIAVWLQDPAQAPRYKAAGINVYAGLWRGPTEDQLARLKQAGIQLICHQNAVALAHRDDPTIVGWMQEDEPDNAQEVRDPVTAKRGYGPPVKPEKVVSIYQKIHDADPTRPVLLNLGQWVANREWRGRGNGAKPEDYLTYVHGGDIISFDVYPIASYENAHPENYLWLVPKGVDQLREWTGGKKIIWNALECTHIGNADRQANPHQVRAEAWMSVIHGSRGIIWFVHQFKPKFDEHALLDDPKMLEAVSAVNHQIHDLAAVVNSGTPADVKVQSSSDQTPIDLMAREHDGATYVFAVGMRNAPMKGTFSVAGMKEGATVEVIGENRTLATHRGNFEDAFAPYDVHLYRIAK